MKKLLIAFLLLGACAHVPPCPQTGLASPVKAPDLPASLAKKHGSLPDLTDPSLSAQQTDAAETDKKYNEVAHQSNALIDVYNCVKDSLENRTNPSICIGKITN